MAAAWLSWQELDRFALRGGRVRAARPVAATRRPGLILEIDFGPAIGVLKSSAQNIDHVHPEVLNVGQVLALVNFPPQQIGPIRSPCLVRTSPLPTAGWRPACRTRRQPRAVGELEAGRCSSPARATIRQ